MSIATREESVFSGQPFELYLFQTSGQSWLLTSSDAARSGPGGEYTPTAIFRTSIGKGAEQKSNSTKVTIPRDHEIAQLFLGSVLATPLTLTIYRGHVGESGTVVQFIGNVMSAAFGEDCELDCAPEEQILRQHIPRLRYQTPCNKVIYSPACGVDREGSAFGKNFKIHAQVTDVAAEVVTAAEFDDYGSGWLTNGYLEWGYFRRMIIRHVATEITLILPIPGLVMDQWVDAFAGCPRTYATCKSKFDNGPNFWGFEWIPGRNPFKGVQY
jgi:uncharacterized phage protein (TIGR02218 family)